MTARLDLPGWLSGDPDVLEALLARRESGSSPQSRDDGHRIVLVVEGGGMRGVCIGGMVQALGRLGLGPAFDEIFAVSAGAFTAIGLVVGDVEHAVSVYVNDLATGGFVSWRRYLSRSGPLIDLDFLIEEVLGQRRGFDFTRLTRGRPRLRPVATDLETLSAVALDDLVTEDDWRRALRASGTVPLFAGEPVEIRGRRYVDGFAADPLPLARAIASGATHVLALVARAPDEPLPGAAGPWQQISGRRYDRLAPGLAALMAERSSSYSDSLAIVTDPEHRHRGDARVLAIRPTHRTGVSALTTDPARLWRGAAAGEDAVRLAVAWAARSAQAAGTPRVTSRG